MVYNPDEDGSHEDGAHWSPTLGRPMPKFNVGDQVWMATFKPVETFIECPDCGGRGHIRCLLHDDTMVKVECWGCRRGWHPPTGKILVYVRTPKPSLTTITGYEVAADKIEYRTSDSYIVDEASLFTDEESAAARSAELAARHDCEELDRIGKKEKDTRSWAWNVHYHRAEIRRAEQSIIYHTSKLNVARVKAKEKP